MLVTFMLAFGNDIIFKYKLIASYDSALGDTKLFSITVGVVRHKL